MTTSKLGRYARRTRALSDRLAFLRQRGEAARRDGKTFPYDEAEASALEWVLSVVAAMHLREIANDPPPEGVPVIVEDVDGFAAVATRTGESYTCACGQAIGRPVKWRPLDAITGKAPALDGSDGDEHPEEHRP
jgi:hypothetical protein